MSVNNIEVRDINSYTEGFNLGYQAAEANRKLTSINASIFKSVFYRDYKDSFYRGVASGWQHSFDLKRQKIKDDLKKQREAAAEKEAQPVNEAQQTQQHAKTQELSPEEKEKRFAQRQAQAQQMRQAQQQRQQDSPEIER